VGDATQEVFGPVPAEREGPNSTFDPLCLTCPGLQWPGPFSVHGSDEQIFGAGEQISERGLSD